MIFNIVIFMCALGGLVMVCGGIVLLYKGAISLTNRSADAMTVEFRKELKISTRYPALGLFVVGLLFFIFSLTIGKPNITKVTIKADTQRINEKVTMRLSPTNADNWISNIEYNGEVVETFYPNLDYFEIVITAPGYKPFCKVESISKLSNRIGDRPYDLGAIILERRVTKDQINRSIEDIPEGIELPGFNNDHGFGMSR